MDIILAVIGVILLIKGNVKVTSRSEVPKAVGRALGIIALVPFLVFFLAGAFGVSDELSDSLGFVLYGLVILAVILAVVFFRREIQPPPASLQK